MRILAIHGVGHCDANNDWQPGWRSAVTAGLKAWSNSAAPDIEFLEYDRFFEQAPLDTGVVRDALLRLAASGLFYGIADRLRNRAGLAGALESVRWTAGMAAQWVALEDLRSQLRMHLAEEIARSAPEVVLAHSLGSLIAYDTFRRDEMANPGGSLIQNATLVTFGSQIGNPAVRAVYGGRIEQLQTNRFWWHLFNEQDDVFTCRIGLPSREKFRTVDTCFDIQGIADHDGAAYLSHEEAARTVWQDLASTLPRGKAALGVRQPPASLARAHIRTLKKAVHVAPQKRALLVGIADYPDEALRLEGPVNDVFCVSASLQELGFPPDSIRVVLNERATTAGIRERLKWLLSDARRGDQLFFFFAGHGAQIAGYGRDSEVDHVDECLVPWDFDWSKGAAITDDEFAALYSQLPYECQFTAVLDCCHSGGMARAGGSRARGLAPPDDIRHRMLRWDKPTQMWLPRRRLDPANKDKPALHTLRSRQDQHAWLGENASMRRLGRGTSLWLPTDRAYRKAVQANGHFGPYTPVMIEACNEGELAYEYRHGVISYGAFTYALCGVLREAAAQPKSRRLDFQQLVAKTGERIACVVSEPQHPQLHCAEVWRNQPIPGL
jgi:metacaspase-1